MLVMVRGHGGSNLANSVALYPIVRFDCGSDADSNRAMRTARETLKTQTYETKTLLSLLLDGSQESVLKVPKRGQCHAAIRVTTPCCDSCAQGAIASRMVPQRNFCDAESLAKRYGEHALSWQTPQKYFVFIASSPSSVTSLAISPLTRLNM